MRLKVFDRILLALLLIVAILFSFILFGVAAGLIKLDLATDLITAAYGDTSIRLALAGGGLFLLLICVKLLFAGRERKAQMPASAIIRQSEIGGTFISLGAIDSMVQKHCRAQTRVRECYSTVRTVENGVSIGVRLSVLPDTEIRALTEELQSSLKTYIEELSGINVCEIGVLVESATSPAPAARME